jgi:hypothetical protein
VQTNERTLAVNMIGSLLCVSVFICRDSFIFIRRLAVCRFESFECRIAYVQYSTVQYSVHER